MPVSVGGVCPGAAPGVAGGGAPLASAVDHGLAGALAAGPTLDAPHMPAGPLAAAPIPELGGTR